MTRPACLPDCDEGHHEDGCPWMEAEYLYWARVYGGMSRDQLRACDPRSEQARREDGTLDREEAELRDAGRIR